MQHSGSACFVEPTLNISSFCDPPITCTKVSGGREYSVVYTNQSHSPLVTFGGQAGNIKGNGLYETTYTLVSGINRITVNGSATLKQEKRTIVCPSCQPTLQDIPRSNSVVMMLYGVDIAFDPIPAILVDKNGYARGDSKIGYTINPAGYKAATASILIYKNGEAIAAIPTETQGSGWGTIAKGFQFDLIANPLDGNNNYEAEVVLNYGSSVAISSGKKKIVVAALEVESKTGAAIDTENDQTINFGNGTADDMTYRIILESQSIIDACNNTKLKGKLKVIDGQGNTITAPDPAIYGKVEYDLDFSQKGTACQVKIKDGDIVREYFIRTSRKTEDLINNGAILDNIAVLFAGADNKTTVQVELATDDGTKKIDRTYPGKPLQVIVLAIDGLRQDVLYPSELDKVQDGGQYRVAIDKTNLPGLSQILTTNTAGKQYIMLPDVTAIFPSVTLASWASVFTGKMPKETGITGNEFFARDFPSCVPSQYFYKPIGIVTFDGGAFKGYTECDWMDKIKGRYFIVPYRTSWQDIADPMDIQQNYVLRESAKTILKP